MADNSISYGVRFYTKNPGGTYDPAHLSGFDIEDQSHLPAIMPGDTICAWYRMGSEREGRNHYYKVIERMFRFTSPTEVNVFVLVEEAEAGWTLAFD